MPEGGGTGNQPYEWKLAMDCLLAAKEQAEYEQRVEEEQARRREEEYQEQQYRGA